jgi:hypothetical protein
MDFLRDDPRFSAFINRLPWHPPVGLQNNGADRKAIGE